MSRGQWVNYDGFNLIELIDELKTRIDEPFIANDTLHGIIILNKDYYSICDELKEFLIEDDKKRLLIHDAKIVRKMKILQRR